MSRFGLFLWCGVFLEGVELAGGGGVFAGVEELGVAEDAGVFLLVQDLELVHKAGVVRAQLPTPRRELVLLEVLVKAAGPEASTSEASGTYEGLIGLLEAVLAEGLLDHQARGLVDVVLHLAQLAAPMVGVLIQILLHILLAVKLTSCSDAAGGAELATDCLGLGLPGDAYVLVELLDELWVHELLHLVGIVHVLPAAGMIVEGVVVGAFEGGAEVHGVDLIDDAHGVGLDLAGVGELFVAPGGGAELARDLGLVLEDPAFILEDDRGPVVLGEDGVLVLELAVEVVELDHDELGEVVLQVLLGVEVDGHVVLDGDVADVAEVVQELRLAQGVLEDLLQVRLEVQLLHVEPQQAAEDHSAPELVVQVPHLRTHWLHPSRLHEPLQTPVDPVHDLWQQQVHIVETEDLEDLLYEQPYFVRVLVTL
eukprot:CAMPEP_0170565488 /NCGR_PEP_ID=MMETSP0211-20121228/79213_1 /TAXON_ID=311385 /ORGANISM="Pseudokeronopsis sp., Strain OXSARD2" /LENGTH=423 /DNA_ID=CAMNT_0010886373 /DNA_START=709 /DNA_END=1977 /DNA_ORIENTATION=-